jgi:hypothetical protein
MHGFNFFFDPVMEVEIVWTFEFLVSNLQENRENCKFKIMKSPLKFPITGPTLAKTKPTKTLHVSKKF